VTQINQPSTNPARFTTYRTVLERHPDAAVVIPPRSNAVPSDEAEPTPRDRHIEMLAEKGRMDWQAAAGYGKRALVETAFYRYKVLIGRSLRARTLSAQKVEARIACKVINRMTSLGIPERSPEHRNRGRDLSSTRCTKARMGRPHRGMAGAACPSGPGSLTCWMIRTVTPVRRGHSRTSYEARRSSITLSEPWQASGKPSPSS
jgi:hypothetical protein